MTEVCRLEWNHAGPCEWETQSKKKSSGCHPILTRAEALKLLVGGEAQED